MAKEKATRRVAIYLRERTATGELIRIVGDVVEETDCYIILKTDEKWRNGEVPGGRVTGGTVATVDTADILIIYERTAK